MSLDYTEFLASKAPRARPMGIEPGAMPEHLFDFQADVVAFGLRQGRSALFLDTGLGKTLCELEWCRKAAEASNGHALILTPLAVARQIEAEAKRFGYSARVVRDQTEVGPGISICNYDRLDKLNPAAFGAVALDESSILKNFNGATTRALIDAFAGTRFKLCATATPAPNDHTELGQHAEFLGIMSQAEMLVRWFVNDTADTGQWRLKGHAQQAFWDWMASWARCAKSPEDLGYDGSRFVLPELRIHRHHVQAQIMPQDGTLFGADVSATNMHALKRQTADARAELVAALVAADPGEPWIIWCDSDAEADALRAVLPAAIEVRGSHPIERKEAALLDFAAGTIPQMITKASIAGRGLNYQNCARMAYVGRSFSYEAWYQSVRRCWRFGQVREVHVHLIVAEGEDQIGRVIDRKAEDHRVMQQAMVAAMRRNEARTSEVRVAYRPTHSGRAPSWLR